MPGCHLFFEVGQADAHLSGHARGWQGRGQGYGMISEVGGNPFRGMRPCLAPVRKLRSQLVELVIAMQRGRDRHVCLPVIEFMF
jgi:hypothetical protein